MPLREWSKRRARIVHNRVPYARESAARQGGRQCPATERQPPKRPADGKRSIVSENALSDGGMHGQKKHLRKNPGKASGTRIRGGDSRLVNSDVRRKTLPATECPPHCPTTPHLRRTRGKQGYNEDSVHDEVVRKEPPSAGRRRPSDDGATVSRQRRAYEKIRPAPGPSRGISSPFRNAAKFVIKISNPIPYHLNTFLFYFYKKQVLRFRRSTPRLSIFKEGRSSFRLFRAILADDVETLPEHHAEQVQNAATNSAAGSAMYRESRSLPRVVRLTPILEFMRKGRRKGGDCGRSAASAGETAACRRQGTRVQTAPTAALLRSKAAAADSPRSDKKARRKSGFRRANMQSEKNQRCFVEMLNVSE